MKLEWIRDYLAFVRSFAPYLFLSLYIYSAPRTGFFAFENLSLILLAGYLEVCFQVVDFLRSGLRWFWALVALIVGSILPLNIVIPVMATVMLLGSIYGSANTVLTWCEIAGDFIAELLDLGAAGQVKLRKTWTDLKTRGPSTGFGPAVMMASATAEHRPASATGFTFQRDTGNNADDDAANDGIHERCDRNGATSRPGKLSWTKLLYEIESLELRLGVYGGGSHG